MPLSFPSSPAVGQTSVQNGRTYQWSGYAWELLTSTGVYTLPAATASVLGGVKVGAGLTITDGVLAAAVGGEDTTLRALFLPAAPTSVTAAAGNAQVSLSWTAPTVLAQTPITDYAVQFKAASATEWTTFTDGTSTATSATVTGLTNGTAYVFRVAAVNGAGTGAYSSASSSVTPISGDPYFGQVALLLHADGTGSTFVDSSPYTRTITANGDVTQSATQSKWGTRSAYFDGSGDYLETTIASIGTGDFVAEAWFYVDGSNSTFRHIFDTRTSDATGFSLGVDDSNRIFLFSVNAFRVQAGTVSANTWHHVALARDSGNVRVYFNGTQVGSTWTDSTNYNQTTLHIGRYYSNVDQFQWLGYLDDIRVTVGSSRGYAGATITVPTAAFPDTDANGLVPDPFFSSVALLLHADGTGSTFVDSSPTPKTITASGDATQSATQFKWGTKSAYFDGSGDYLTVPAIPLGDNFAIECWVYPVSRATTLPCVWGNYNSYASGALALFAGHLAGNTSKYQLAVNGGSFPSVQSTSDIIYGAWSHIAVVRSGNTLTLYINGATEGSMSVAGMTFGGVGPTFAIGLSQDNPSAAFHGYVDDFRITAGQSRYSGTTITVPATAFPDRGTYEDPFMEQVSLLLHADGTGSTFVDSSLTQKTITANGSATQSTTQSKFGGKSAALNLSGGDDYLTAPHNSGFSFQSGEPFTVELWYYPTSFGTYNYLISKGADSVYREWALGCTASSVNWYIKAGGDVNYVASATVSLNTWTHIAVSCDGSTVSIYKDGTRIGTTSFSTPDGYGQATNLTVGKFLNYSNIAHEGRGYFDDIRITKAARYTGTTITVPTAAFPNA